jgi:hypothetical protein
LVQDLWQHLAQPAASVQHLAQVAASLQQAPVQAVVAGLQHEPDLLVAQPVVKSAPVAITAARIIMVFILVMCLFRFIANGWSNCHW